MEKAYSVFAQSRFFTSAFNSAIYDGPIRIYFSQSHEAAGLSVYFTLTKNHPESVKRLKEFSKRTGENVFLLIYPDEEHFNLSFNAALSPGKSYDLAFLGGHRVIGIKSPLAVDDLAPIMQEVVDWTETLARTTDNQRVAEL